MERERDGLEYFASMIRLVAHNQANPGIVSLFAVLSSEASAPVGIRPCPWLRRSSP